jgi:hypothetical protein
MTLARGLGSPGLDAENGASAGPSVGRLVCQVTAALCEQVYHDKLAAIVLTGSLARNEATVVRNGDDFLLRSDADFILVFEPRAPLPVETDIVVIQRKIADRLRGLGLRASITLAAVYPKYLRRLTPSIFAYELLACGSVVWGDRSVLSLIPRFSVGDIPREDAWHLLCNRVIEHLAGLESVTERVGPSRADSRYCTIKLFLDMATSYLLFVGHYAPTYAWRLDNLRTVTRHAAGANAPFCLPRFCADVAECTRSKLASDERHEPDQDDALMRRGLECARRLWRWELAQLAAAPPDLDERHLIECWMRRQPILDRVRGWLYVMRRQGWLRSYQAWPHWMRLAWRTSPRYAVYMTGCPLAFSVLEHGASGQPPDWDILRRQLPVFSDRLRPDDPASHRLAADVALNYSRFLVGTRS